MLDTGIAKFQPHLFLFQSGPKNLSNEVCRSQIIPNTVLNQVFSQYKNEFIP